MTVAELIELLTYENPNARVWVQNDSEDAYASILEVMNVDSDDKEVFIEAQ